MKVQVSLICFIFFTITLLFKKLIEQPFFCYSLVHPPWTRIIILIVANLQLLVYLLCRIYLGVFSLVLLLTIVVFQLNQDVILFQEFLFQLKLELRFSFCFFDLLPFIFLFPLVHLLLVYSS
jgi:hypothetical protein